ncbi:hypothetical protein MTY66_31570 [Mycolicibacterium sp. TY66]|uniref:Serine aminopeptidase S33 domain-containing protein n=1 Tax=Mycolicibacterium mucogenicum TaxID=56689 RepID=A0A1A0MWX3_MYCMU|nr:hypothetical protein A5642_15270 [Mycolicibacterium mucogenicum]TXH23599.1 MAG: alpha/beta fold hydrolase [Mycobacterium sp.]BCI81532.1 hypothetical protein MTY66_31570 [Mycolicibacterium sp. TY66]BCJ80813.1 hypothetical protein MTY81_21860 [Mycolicibacterium sp. TY81]
MRGKPTWFGPERSRLFGVVHSPEGGAARAGVIICPPLGRQQLYSYRGLKLLAQELCAKGFAVLRFDYPGTGDSTGAQSRDSAVTDFVEGVRTAVDYMRSAGVQRVSLVGVRAGALLAAVAAESVAGLECVVLWDPVTDGRRYVREQQSLYRVSVSDGGSDELPDEVGAVQLLGMPLSSAAAAELSALKMPSVVNAARLLVLTRPEYVGDRRLAGLDVQACEAQVISGQPEFLEPRSVFFKIPTDTVAAIEKWMDANSASESVPFRPGLLGSAVVEVLPDGREIVESFVELGPDRLFGIRTAIAGTREDGPTVLIHNTACEHRVGSGRIWPDSARELATLGVNVVRYDRRGVGETGIANDQYTGIHSAAAQSDVTAAVHALGVPSRNLMMTGICSGAWNSAYAGSRYGVRLVVLLNLLLYSWRRVDGVAERFAYMAEAPDNPPRLRQRTWETVKKLLRDDLPYPGWLLLGHLGYTQAPEVLMTPLMKKGVRTELVLSPSDYEWYQAHRGPIGANRLARRGSTPKLTAVPGGDHAVLHRGLQIFMRKYLVDAARREFSASP